MPLIECPECGKEVSSNAPTCPGCGSPIAVATPLSPKKGDLVPYTDQEAAVMISKKPKTSHLLHFFMSIITAGVWMLVWLLMGVNNSIECSRIDRRIAKGKKFKG